MNLKPQQSVNKRTNLIIALLILIGTLVVYYLTLARSLSFWDAGEYITCGSILGVPHPPGNPFYIVLSRFSAIVGMGLSHAFVINFLSAILSAFAVMFTYLISVKLVTMWIKPSEAYYAYIAGFIAAAYTAFSFTFWNNAIEAEVYSGLAFVINLIVLLTLTWTEKSEDFSHQNYLLLIIYLFFLGFGIHQTSLQIAPAVLFIAVYPMLKTGLKQSGFWMRTIIYFIGFIVIYLIFFSVGVAIQIPDLAKYIITVVFALILYWHLRGKIEGKVWLFALFLIAVGLSTHFFLWFRSAHRPFINEGHPDNWEAFTYYIFRRQYGPTSMFDRRATFLFQMKDQFLTYFSWQFFNTETLIGWFKTPFMFMRTISNIIVTFLGFGGLYYHLKKNKHSFAYFFAFFFMASIAMVIVMNLSDAEVRERDYFFTTAYNFWTVWMGLGSIALIELARRKSKALSMFAAVVVIALPIINLASQYHIHDRHDEYIALDYGQNILNSLEENAIIFTNGDNDTFPVWYAQAVMDPAAKEYVFPAKDVNPTDQTKKDIKRAMEFKEENCFGIRKDVSVANLSLLNTPWYIKQIRDNEGIEFNLPDPHIEKCQESQSSALYPRQVPNDTKLTIKGTEPGDEFTITFKKGTVLYIKDLATIQIIKDNYGKRPIYFAVTAPDAIGFEDHLRNEGMVDRLVSSKSSSQMDIERVLTNIDSVYSYRGVFDDAVYKDPNMLRLLNNYGSGYIARASQHFLKRGDYAKSIQFMEKGLQFIQNKQRFYPGLSQLYMEASFDFLDKEEFDEGFEYIEKAIYYNRTDANLVMMIYQAGVYTKEYAKAAELLNKLKQYQEADIIDLYIAKLASVDTTKTE